MSAPPPEFLERLSRLPRGYGEGRFEGRAYGATLSTSPDGRRLWLFAEELGGNGLISCNVYRLAGGRVRLLPCEMPAQRVIDFVLGFEPFEG